VQQSRPADRPVVEPVAEDPEAVAPPAITQPNSWRADQRLPFDGAAGNHPQYTARLLREPHVPWVCRQFAVTRCGDVAYTSNRFQLSGYDLKEFKRLWRSDGPDNRPADQWPLHRTKPLVTPEAVYCRHLRGRSTTLRSYRRDNGQTQWEWFGGDREHLISDPFIEAGSLYVLTLEPQPNEENMLKLVTLDAADGEKLDEIRLLRLRRRREDFHACQIAQQDDLVVVALGGAVVCLRADGAVQWVRTAATPPADLHHEWAAVAFEPPLIRDGVVYLADPGTLMLQAVYLADGRLVWQKPLPDWARPLGLHDDALLIRTRSGFAALDAGDGSVRWRQTDFAAREATLLPAGDRWLHVSGSVLEGGEWMPELIWRSYADGRVVARQPLPELTAEDPHLRRLTILDGALWVLYAEKAGRTFRRVGPSYAERRAAAGAAATTRHWQFAVVNQYLGRLSFADVCTAHVHPGLAKALGNFAPQWTAVATPEGGRPDILIENFHGSSGLRLSVSREHPTVLAVVEHTPQPGADSLALSPATDGGKRNGGRVVVRFGERVVLDKSLPADAVFQKYADLRIELAEFHDKTAPLIIELHPGAAGDACEMVLRTLKLE
jgi:outer membrane protein assembly factor BamB